jgi:hypothetical protein
VNGNTSALAGNAMAASVHAIATRRTFGIFVSCFVVTRSTPGVLGGWSGFDHDD